MLGPVLVLALATATRAPASTEPAAPAPVAPALVAHPPKHDPLQVHSVVLANGLTVMLSVNRERPEVFGAVVVRTGGKNDPQDDTGMAHYLEHMLFKGTTDLGTTDWQQEKPLQDRLAALFDRKRAATPAEQETIDAEIAATLKKTYAFTVPNELDQMLGQLGGTGINAFTTYDETVYHNTFPASQIDGWLRVSAHRFADPVFRLFPSELEAVYEEKNSAMDTTGYELFRSFMRGAFPGHPYGRNDILGEVEHLKRPSLTAMRAYFDRWYVPGNMALVLSGDLDVARVLPVIESTFGAWRARPLPQSDLAAPAPFEPDQRLAARATPVRVGAVAFRTVPESHPDYAALLLARRLLANEQRSGLIDRLSDGGELLFAVHVPADLADTNLDVVAYIPRLVFQTFRGAERKILEQFRKIRDGEFDERTFAALKQGLLTAEAARWEDNEKRALAMAHAYVARGGWQGHLDFLARLAEVTRADVMRVAREHFGERRLILRSRVGYPKKTRLDKPRFPPVTPGRGHSKFYEAEQAIIKPAPQVAFVEPTAVATVHLRDGVTLRHNSNPFNDLYHLELRFGVGEHAIHGLDLLADYLQRIGTTSVPAAELRERLFDLSTNLTARSELDRFVVRLQGPQVHMDAALALLADLLAHPSGERRPLRQVRREVWAFRRYERKNPSSVGKALRDHVLYGDNSRFHREVGPTGARLLGPRRLLRALAEVQRHAVEIGYVGREAPATVAAAINKHLTFAESPHEAVPHVVYARNAPSKTTVYFVPRRDAVQTQLWFAVEGAPVAVVDRPAADAFGEYFGGSMAGLVFQEIREFRALAYSASARWGRDEHPGQRGHLLGHVACQADKTFDALDVMLGLITDMPARPERLELVRSALLRSQETESPSFRELQDQLRLWHHLGHDEDPRRARMPAYEHLEFNKIVDFYRRYVAGKPLAIMVVGDPRKVRPKDLKKYGELVRLREGRLYSP